MTLIRSAKRMAAMAHRLRQRGKRIGVVPTMGALHEGHGALIRAAASQNDVVIVTVFVNPLQFGPHDDFRRYPRTLRRDVQLARASGAKIIFAPGVGQIYPKGFQTTVRVGAMARRWEGSSRPGHFEGVATVVAILLELTRPTHAYFGQKDYQQSLIVERLIRDLHLPVRFHRVPTVREPDGLAMSSRNASLSPVERRQAASIHQALNGAARRIRAGERDAARLIDGMRRLISEAPGARIDYVAIVDAKTLEPVWRLRGRVALLAAAWIGRTRLIDNLLVDVS
ncbi:MAG: pantoate--beta-alanine ligase [Candidatus Omnitrophica bacterium]|nr:pantoate--beta-alanine ligase [Candidatus Omnitrophota bacterium]